MMNQIPVLLRMFAGDWMSIRVKAQQAAMNNGIEYADQREDNFRYDGWGLVGFPPRIACNVKYIHFDTGNVVDLGRITA